MGAPQARLLHAFVQLVTKKKRRECVGLNHVASFTRASQTLKGSYTIALYS